MTNVLFMNNFDATPNVYPNLITPLNVPLSATLLNDERHFRLNRINKIKDYFVAEIKGRELMSKRFSKYIPSFDYFDNSLIALSVTTGSLSITSFATVTGAPVGVTSANFTLAFSVCTGIVKIMFKTTKSKKKKHNKIVMLAGSKSNSIESKISEALINHERLYDNYEDFMKTHEDFMMTVMKTL